MAAARRIAVALDPRILRALRLRAAASDRSISEMVNEAVKQMLVEGAEDLAAVASRRREPTLDFAQFVKTLSRGRKV